MPPSSLPASEHSPEREHIQLLQHHCPWSSSRPGGVSVQEAACVWRGRTPLLSARTLSHRPGSPPRVLGCQGQRRLGGQLISSSPRKTWRSASFSTHKRGSGVAEHPSTLEVSDRSDEETLQQKAASPSRVMDIFRMPEARGGLHPRRGSPCQDDT